MAQRSNTSLFQPAPPYYRRRGLGVSILESIAGAGAVDGDTLELDFNPGNYAPSTVPPEATALDQLAAHLAGIDNALGGAVVGTVPSVVADIATRNALTPATGELSYVVDASADGTVTAGAAFYLWDGAAWQKIAEDESLDVAGSTPAALVPPAAADQIGVVGVSLDYARQDHAHPAQSAAVTLIADAGTLVAATDVEGALQEGASEWTTLRTLSGTVAGATDLGSLAGSTITTGATFLAALGELEAAHEGHAARHIQGGADAIDGDQIDIDFAPSNYTPSTLPAEVTDAGHLSAHLAGIDTLLGAQAALDVVANIAARDALTAAAGDRAYVTDASADASVVSGAAFYLYDGAAWLKVSEAESMDHAAIAVSPAATDQTGAVGTSLLFARGDHAHPAQNAAVTDIADAGTLITATEVEGALQEGAAEWTTLRTLSGTVAGATGVGDLAGSTVTTGATILTALGELEAAIEANPQNRLFADETTVAPATSGSPTDAEISTFAGVNVDRVVVYNGTDVDGGAYTHVWHLDRSGDVTRVSQPAGTANTRIFADDTTVAPALTGAPTEAEIATFAGASVDTFVYYTGNDTSTDPATYVFHVDAAGTVTLLQAPVAGVSLSTLVSPEADDQVGLVGVATPSAREDHKHPAQSAAVTDIADAGTLITATEVEGALQEGAAEWTTLRTLSGTVAGATGVGDLAGSTVTTGANILTALGELEAAIEASPQDRLFADETTVAPATSGSPTDAEISTFAGANVDRVVVYNGTDVDGGTYTHVWHLDRSGNVTRVSQPASTANTRIFADDTTVAPVLTGAPTEAEIATFAGANRDTVIYYTGSDTSTDAPSYVFHIDLTGAVTLLDSNKPSTVITATTATDVAPSLDQSVDYNLTLSSASAGDINFLSPTGSIAEGERVTVSLINIDGSGDRNVVFGNDFRNKEGTVLGSVTVDSLSNYRVLQFVRVGSIYLLMVDSAEGLNALRPWAANTNYFAGDPAVSPGGALILRGTEGQTTAQFDTTEAASWTYLGQVAMDAAWQATTYYFVDQSVSVSGVRATRVASGDSGAALDTTEAGAWSLASQKAAAAWSAATAYLSGQRVQEAGVEFRRIIAGVPSNASFLEDIALWIKVPFFHEHREVDRFMSGKHPATIETGTGSLTRVLGDDASQGSVYRITDTDATINSSHRLDLDMAFAAGDSYQFRMLFRKDAANANHVMFVAYANDGLTEGFAGRVEIGSGQTAALAGPAVVIGTDYTGSLGVQEVDRGDGQELVQVDIVINWTTASDPVRHSIIVGPCENLTGVDSTDTTALGEVDLVEFEHGAVSEFVVSATPTATVLDSSGGASVETLAAATGSGTVLYFASDDVQSNSASLVPQAGESLNGTTDGTFLFSSYSDGTQFRATDKAAGEWVIAVEGAEVQQELGAYSTRGLLANHNLVTGVEALPLSNLIQADTFEGVDWSVFEDNTQSWRTGEVLTVPTGMGGRYTVTFEINHPSTNYGGGASTQATASLAAGGLRINGTDAWYALDDAASLPDQIFTTFDLTLSEGDTIQLIVESSAETNEDLFINLMFMQRPTTTAVLAGMVTPEALTYGVANKSATQSGVTAGTVITFDGVVSGDIAFSSPNFSLLAGARYRLRALLGRPTTTGSGSVQTFDITDTSGTPVGDGTVGTVGGADHKGNQEVVKLYSPPTNTDVQLRCVANTTGTVGVGEGTSFIVEQIPVATVVMPEALVPETLSSMQVRLSATTNDSGAANYGFDTVVSQVDGTDPLVLEASGAVSGLKAGKTYRLTANMQILGIGAGNWEGRFVDLTNGAAIGTSFETVTATFATHASGQGGMALFVPSTDCEVGVDYNAGTVGELSSRSVFTIEEVSPMSVTVYQPDQVEATTLQSGYTNILNTGVVNVTSSGIFEEFPVPVTMTLPSAGTYELTYSVILAPVGGGAGHHLRFANSGGAQILGSAMFINSGTVSNSKLITRTVEYTASTAEVISLQFDSGPGTGINIAGTDTASDIESFIRFRQLPTTEVVTPGDVPVESVYRDRSTLTSSSSLIGAPNTHIDTGSSVLLPDAGTTYRVSVFATGSVNFNGSGVRSINARVFDVTNATALEEFGVSSVVGHAVNNAAVGSTSYSVEVTATSAAQEIRLEGRFPHGSSSGTTTGSLLSGSYIEVEQLFTNTIAITADLVPVEDTAFGRITQTVAQTGMAFGSDVVVNFDATQVATNITADLAGNQLTVTQAGRYHITGAVRSNSGTNDATYSAKISIDGAVVATAGESISVSDADVRPNPVVSYTGDLAVGQAIGLAYRAQGPSSTRDMDPDGGLGVYLEAVQVAGRTVLNTENAAYSGWLAYTPVVTSPGATDPSFGAGAALDAYYKQVGDSLHIMVNQSVGGAGPSAGTGDHYTWSLPSGFTPATWAVSTFESSGAGMMQVGSGSTSNVLGGSTSQGSGPVFLVADGLCYMATADVTQTLFISSTHYPPGNPGESYSFKVEIPIV